MKPSMTGMTADHHASKEQTLASYPFKLESWVLLVDNGSVDDNLLFSILNPFWRKGQYLHLLTA